MINANSQRAHPSASPERLPATADGELDRVLRAGQGRVRGWSRSIEESGPRRLVVASPAGMAGINGTVIGGGDSEQTATGLGDLSRELGRALAGMATDDAAHKVTRNARQTDALGHGHANTGGGRSTAPMAGRATVTGRLRGWLGNVEELTAIQQG